MGGWGMGDGAMEDGGWEIGPIGGWVHGNHRWPYRLLVHNSYVRYALLR